MKNLFKNFPFPYKNTILIVSGILIFAPVVILSSIGPESTKSIIDKSKLTFKLLFLVPTFLATLGFVYSTLGYHFQILRGDELKLRIHLESLNVAFTATIIFFFLLIFAFLNFSPTMLNWILVILAIVGIITYLLATQFIRDKYQ